MTAGWKTVLDDQLDLYRFWRSRDGAIAAFTFAESMRNVALDVGGKAQLDQEDFVIDHLLEIETLKAFACEPIYVAEEMMDLVEFAAQTFTPEPLQPSDLVTMAGFLVLPRPMFMRDRRGANLGFRVVSWYPATQPNAGGQTGVHLSLYSHLDDPDDGGEIWEAVKHVRDGVATPYVLLHVTPWGFDQKVPGVGEPARAVVDGGWWTPVQALLRVMMQTVSDRTREKAPRAAGRRWQREKPNFEPYVTVVRLRRPRQKGSDSQEHEVEWTKRWLVSGHWRNQWFPSLQMHRQIWISPFVKGPPDKPLVIRKGHAFEFVK